MAEPSPTLTTWMHGFERLHRHLQDARNLRRAVLPLDGVFDRHLLHSEMISDQWGEGCHRTAFGTAENGTKSSSLVLIGTVVDVGCERPVTLRHGGRSMGDHGNVEPVERHLAIAALLDGEGERDVANALARPRRQRRAGRDKARAQDIATAVLKVIPGEAPFLLRGHLLLPFVTDGTRTGTPTSLAMPPPRARTTRRGHVAPGGVSSGGRCTFLCTSALDA